MLPAYHNRRRFTWLRRKCIGTDHVRGEVNGGGVIRFYSGGRAPRIPGGIVLRYPSRLPFNGSIPTSEAT